MLLPGFTISTLGTYNASIEIAPEIRQKVIGKFHPISANGLK